MSTAAIDLAVITDPDTITYLTDYANYLGIEFGRPTLLVLPLEGDPVLITPLMEAEMCANMTGLPDIRPWADGVNDEWRSILRAVIAASPRTAVALQRRSIPAAVANDLVPMLAGVRILDLDPLIADLRTVKSPGEIATMRQAGEVALAMVEAARLAIGPGVPEYEIALAVIDAGTRKAADLLDPERDRFVSPTIYNLQILQSGADTCMVHRRSSTRRMRKGDPVYLCFCGIANFRHMKLGFDREFFVQSVSDEQGRVYETALAAQQRALAAIRPGVTCQAVNAAAEEVYRQAGFSPGYRTGRSIGYSFLESPELKRGETTPLRAGMTFAVDGGITMEGTFGGRVGDSIVVTESGFDYLTPYPRDLAIIG
jgi:Xaa-Pro dipeptidase